MGAPEPQRPAPHVRGDHGTPVYEQEARMKNCWIHKEKHGTYTYRGIAAVSDGIDCGLTVRVNIQGATRFFDVGFYYVRGVTRTNPRIALATFMNCIMKEREKENATHSKRT
jgi:hypothetical protein